MVKKQTQSKVKPKAKVTNKEPKYRVGEKVKLNNKWAKQFKADGLDASVESVRHDNLGNAMYTIKVFRPMNLVAREEELS